MARKKANETPEIKEPITTRGGKITQVILKKYRDNNKRFHRSKAMKSALREVLVPLLQNGADIEDGPLDAVVRPITKLNVDWRAEFVKAKGEQAAQRIERKKKNKRVEKHLIVE